MSVLKWGLIGCGDIARKRVAPALKAARQSQFVAVSRSRPELAETFAREFGAKRWHSNWKQLLDDSEVDAVYIATPVDLHCHLTIAAARAGKHILCEKPMALSVAECDQMLAACTANQVSLGLAYYRHFYPVLGRIKTILASGELGTPVLARIEAFEWFDPEPGNPRTWLLDSARAGGGPMFDFGCHRIEVLMNLFGTIQKVRSLLNKAYFAREVEDTATAIFSFESGSQAVLSVTHAAREPRDTLEIFGTEGSIRVPVLNEGKLIIRNGGSEREESHPPHSNLHLPLIDDFIQAVLGGRTPKVDGRAGREVQRIEAEIYRQD